MFCDWEGNRRSGVALAMRHRLEWFIHLLAQGLSTGDEHPTNTSDGVLVLFTFLWVSRAGALLPVPSNSLNCPRPNPPLLLVLPLPSARPAVTFPAAEHHRPLVSTKLYCLVKDAHRCEQLAQGSYVALPRVGFEPATYSPQVQRSTRCATAPPPCCQYRKGKEKKGRVFI